jgi:hypothetical protein
MCAREHDVALKRKSALPKALSQIVGDFTRATPFFLFHSNIEQRMNRIVHTQKVNYSMNTWTNLEELVLW